MLHLLQRPTQHIHVTCCVEQTEADSHSTALRRAERLVSQRGTMVAGSDADAVLGQVSSDPLGGYALTVEHQGRSTVLRQINGVSLAVDQSLTKPIKQLLLV